MQDGSRSLTCILYFYTAIVRSPIRVSSDSMTTSQPSVPDDLSHLSNDELAAAVATLAAHIHAATWRLLTLIAELDRRGVWADQGALTCAHWLGWACGIDAHTAREKVRVARALKDLPLLSAAAARGELGYSKLRALTRIATAENEADLVDIGLHGTAQHVEKFVRLYRQAERAQETEHADTRHRERSLAYWYEEDGTLVLHGRCPPETGARILSALDAAMEAHAAEQPASQWSGEGEAPEVPAGGRSDDEARGHAPAFSGTGRGNGAGVPRGTPAHDTSPEPSAADRFREPGDGLSAHVPGGTSRGEAKGPAQTPGHCTEGRSAEAGEHFSPHVPGGTYPRRPSHTVRRADALAWMAERVFEEGAAPALSPHRLEIPSNHFRKVDQSSISLASSRARKHTSSRWQPVTGPPGMAEDADQEGRRAVTSPSTVPRARRASMRSPGSTCEASRSTAASRRRETIA